MLKNILFRVMASLCLKKCSKPIQKCLVGQFTVNRIYHLRLLAELARSEIRLHYLRRKALERYLILLLSGFIFMQARSQTVTPLKIGEKLPKAVSDIPFAVVGNTYKAGDSIKLSQYQGKIILLDFWATWCTNCIYKFPLLEELQQKYPADLVIVLVDTKRNKDTIERINKVLKGEKEPHRQTNLFTIYNDTLLHKVFPHSFLPHYVWIGPDGKLKLLSSAEMLNPATIAALLPKQPLTSQKR